jgi:hypothetical protein
MIPAFAVNMSVPLRESKRRRLLHIAMCLAMAASTKGGWLL